MEFDFRDELGKMAPPITRGAKIYIFGCGANWDYICKQYKYLVNVNIDEYIDGFIDNNIAKQGSEFHGKLVCSLGEVSLDNAVVLISVASGKANYEISWQLTQAGLLWRHSFFTADCFLTVLMRWEYLRLAQFKNLHKGKRCFIIGNGPSLTVSDLDKLKSEITFASNNIHLLFDKTEWRPSYYVIHDNNFLVKGHKIIKEKLNCPIFFAYNSVFDIDDFALNSDYFYYSDGRVDWKPIQYDKPSFSKEPYVLQWGATVTYDCLQLAVYMGFSEVYLLGIDHSFPIAASRDGKIVRQDMQGHFSVSYGSNIYFAQIDTINAAYQVAKEYGDSYGIKIRNATHGGKLEIFERVVLDTLL